MSKKQYTKADYDAAEVWWRKRWNRNKIEDVRVLSQTPKTVLFLYDRGGEYEAHRRHKFGSYWHGIYRTWREAHAALVAKSLREIESTETELAKARERLVEACAMTEPCEEAT